MDSVGGISMGHRPVNRVLVADDDELLLRAFRQGLERRNVSAFTATTRQAALQLARSHRPQLAIVDLKLGADSGIELLEELRSDDPGIVLVMITGYGSIDVAVRAVKAGADDVVEKPVTLNEILARVRGPSDCLVVETPSADRALWEHVHRVLGDCDGNKSEAARRLQRPRSWLRRFLSRSAPLS